MHDTRRALLGGIATGIVGTAGCTGATDGGEDFTLTTSAFDAGETIPRRYTCEGADESPPLSVSGVPDAAETLGVVVDDPDAPGATFTHWLLWNVPGETTAIPAAVATTETVDALDGARQGENDFGDVGYRGPCPPTGDGPHTYRFRGYAVDSTVDVAAGSDASAVTNALEDASLATDVLTGTFER
jgi:hypothetical protein